MYSSALLVPQDDSAEVIHILSAIWRKSRNVMWLCWDDLPVPCYFSVYWMKKRKGKKGSAVQNILEYVRNESWSRLEDFGKRGCYTFPRAIVSMSSTHDGPELMQVPVWHKGSVLLKSEGWGPVYQEQLQPCCPGDQGHWEMEFLLGSADPDLWIHLTLTVMAKQACLTLNQAIMAQS